MSPSTKFLSPGTEAPSDLASDLGRPRRVGLLPAIGLAIATTLTAFASAAQPQPQPLPLGPPPPAASLGPIPSVTAAGMDQQLAPSGPAAAVPAGPPISALPLAPSGSPVDRARWLTSRIDEILGRATLTGAKIAVAVGEIESGKLLYAKNEKTLLNPASNAKLFTTAAALGLIGPEFRYKTLLLADSVRGGEIPGALYLKGTGDPSLVSEDLWRMVATLASSGIKSIKGGIIVDDSYFDDQRIAPAFEQKDDDSPFRAANGAVSVNYNACAVHVFPAAKEGSPPRILVEPVSPYFVVVNQAKTVKKGKADLLIDTKEIDGHTQVIVTGAVHVGSGERVDHKRIIHPDLYAGYTLRELLLRRGIKVSGEVQRGLPIGMPQPVPAPPRPGAVEGSTEPLPSQHPLPTIPAKLRTLATHLSLPLGVIVREVNKTSNNFMAEQILKTLGAEVGGKPGTWQKGVEGVGKFLEGIGIAPGKYKMTNGSGLYDANRFSASQLIELLRAGYRDFRWASDFIGSLAVAGADGTIGHRMEGSPAQRFVRAKTGTLNGVSCLSGYAGALGRVPLVFSILINDLSDGATPDARKVQDSIAEALVIYLDAK